MRLFGALSASSALISCQALLLMIGAPASAQSAPPSSDSQADTDRQSSRAEDLRGTPQVKFNFKVAAGPLKTVLDDIAAQSGSTYRAERTQIPDVGSPGVAGKMTLHEAVVRALFGTNVHVVNVTRGEIRLATDQAEGSQSEIVVTARQQSFKENFSSAATHTDTPLRETPATVDVVTQDVLQSRNSFTLGEALRNIPGAIFQAGSPNVVHIGPDSTTGITFTDGLRNGGLADNEPTVLAESVEVLKGPASLLTGSAVAGGLINYVPKRANGVSPADISLGIGSGYETTASADFGGSVPGVSNLYYRVIAFAQHAKDNPAGGNNPYQYVVSPMLGYRSNDTEIDLSGQYFKQRTAYARRDYLNADGQAQSFGALYNPDAFIGTEFKQVNYNVEQKIVSSPDLTLTFRAKGLYQDGNRSVAVAQPARLVGSSFLVVSIGTYVPEKTTSHYADLYAKFNTGPVQHQVILAGDYYWDDQQQHTSALAGFGTPATSLPLPAIPRDTPATTSDKATQYGAVVQDQMTWGPVHALIGIRHSWYRDTALTSGATQSTTRDVQKWLPNAGVVLDITKAISIYGSYSRTFAPQQASVETFEGNVLPPQLTERWEAGFKTGFFNDKLDLNGSVYRYTTSNYAFSDPLHPTFYIGASGKKVKGFELSAVGSVTPSLKITAGYSYGTGTIANQAILDQVPHDIVNVWVLKSFTLANGNKIGVGVGGNYNDGFYVINNDAIVAGTSVSTIKFDRHYLSLDSSLSYTIGKTMINVTVDNLANRKNYGLSGGTYQLERAEPRTFRVVLDTKF